MRPLRLRIQGLRSYVAEQEIDFTGAGLFAIIGDTGAGKSSILEAICFALYGAATWNAREVKDLISDQADTVRVELTFLADGQRWKVTRASSTRSYPPPIHELHGLDDPEVRIDGASNVTKFVEQRVGLDYHAFLRAVVLPQGRFQELLLAAPSERTRILKGIFRLDLLERMREQTDRLHRENLEKIHQLKIECAGMLEDPPAIIARESAVAARSQQEIAAIETTRKQVDTLLTEAQRCANGTEALAGAAEQLGEHLSREPSLRLTAIVAEAIPLIEESTQLERELAGAKEEERALAERLGRADRARLGPQDLARCAEKLSQLRESLAATSERESSRVRRAREIKNLATTAAKETKVLARLESALATASTQLIEARQSHAEAAERSTLARVRLKIARERAAEIPGLTDELRAVETLLGELTKQKAHLTKGAASRKRALASAQESLEQVQRKHAAAHASTGVAPGDPCPVCARELPDSFRPVSVPAEASAREQLQKAEASAREAESSLVAIRAALEQGTIREKQCASALARHQDRLGASQAELRDIIPGADLNRTDEEILALLASSAPTTLANLETIAETARENRDAAARQLDATRFALGSAQELAALEEVESERVVSARNQIWAALPPGLLGGTRRPRTPTVDLVEEAERTVTAEAASLSKITEDLRNVRSRLEEMRQRETGLRQQQIARLGRPLQAIQNELAVLRERSDQALSLRERELSAEAEAATAPRPAAFDSEHSDNPDAVLDWARSLEGTAREILVLLESDATRLADRASAARTDAWRLLSAAMEDTLPDESDPPLDVEIARSRRALEDSWGEATVTLRAARAQLAEARQQLPRWRTVSEALAQGRPIVDALGELTRLLADGKFVGHVVTQQQRGLLAVASELLRQTSGGRFGFAETFEVVDLQTGQVRGVKTLSGGETFLASLSLALGLVELAGRRGGRLDALFLDEGFGSLDANSLAEALEALGRQATSGRLVAVISHLQAVAESIDEVLLVTRSSEGSRARWVRGHEREALVLEEAGRGLLV